MNQKISAFLAISLAAAPIVLPTSTQANYTGRIEEVSSVRSSNRRMRHQLAMPEQIKPVGTYVGELQEKWQFPSDHLPIGMKFDDFNVLSFNVLDSDYMSWVIEKNSQGLSRSMIADEHVYIGDSGLTLRDRHVVDLLLQSINNPHNPRSLLALQECNEPFLQELRSKLPVNFEVISHFGEAVVVDRNRFQVMSAQSVSGIFADAPYRTIQDIQLRRLDTGSSLRVINAHLPGDPLKPARYEFGQYISQTLDPSMATLAMGDMNFNEREMKDAFDRAFGGTSPFSILTPCCTNISPYEFVSKAIDHFFVYSPDPLAHVSQHRPDEVMEGLGKIVALLEGKNLKSSADEIALYSQQNCLNEGTLLKTRDYVYLKLNEENLSMIFNKIKEKNPNIRMPSFKNGVGPHISIIRHDEWNGVPPEIISELGNQFMFKPVRVDVVDTAHKRLWILVVEPSEELAALREKYANGALPHGHEFHITLAQEPL